MRQVNRRQFCGRLVLVPAVVSGMPEFLLAQARQGTTPAARSGTAANAIITITKTDGTTLRGQILAVDPEKISFKPAPRANDRGTPQPIDVPWKEIKTVSNGMTYQKALADWKQAHHDKLCAKCHGDREIVCPTCKGTAHDPSALADCQTCKGSLQVACKTPKCEKGMIPCPGPCLKLSEGTWTVQDGMKVRTFKVGTGTAWISEHHLGQLFTIDPKNGIQLGPMCPTCGGKTVIEDPACHGSGEVACPTCLARTDAPACPSHCDQGHTKCPDCKGTGLKTA